MRFLVTGREQDYAHYWTDTLQPGTLDEFLYWISDNTKFQLDTETTMVKDSPDAINTRELLLIQIGSVDKSVQWLLEWTVFKDSAWINVLKYIFEDTNNEFFLHNARFDYVVIKTALDIRVENVHDTYLMSKILNTGLDLVKGYHSLSGCLNRFFSIDLDKASQTTFTKETLTLEQIEYASLDVVHLHDLFLKLKALLESWNLWYLYNSVEREALKAFGDMDMNCMKFDKEYWSKLAQELKEEDLSIEKDLNDEVMKDSKLVNYLKNSSHILGTKLIQDEDEITINWGSNVDRKEVLVKLIPELSSVELFTKPSLKAFYKSSDEKFKTSSNGKLLWNYMERNYNILNRYLKLYHKNWLLDKEMFVPAGKININWASNVQKLFIFQFYYPNLKNTDSKALKKIYTNPIITKFKKYSGVHKNVTTYGDGFIENYVKNDGTISPSGLNQILNTGRISYGILLQMPGQQRFRNAFYPPYKDWVFVDSDWVSAELAIMAWLAKEESLLDVVRTGKDAHMFVAQKLFPNEWAEGAEPSCIQMDSGLKCECMSHNSLRKSGKAFNFGIPFGMTYVGLADRLDKSREEAKTMLDFYYKTFPALHKFFNEAEAFSMKNNYVIGALPTGRIRFFHPPANDGERQAIGREGKNLKIQECNASMLKIALIKLRQYILNNNYPAQLCLPVHDEILSACRKDKAEEWSKIQDQAMREAADMFLESGLLGTDTKILERWTK